MTFPHHPGKHRGKAVVTPFRFHRYVARRDGTPPAPAPPNLILLFGRSWKPFLEERYPRGPSPSSEIVPIAPRVGALVLGGIGAPLAAIAAEETMAIGVRRIVILGMAGSLQPGLDVGSVVLCRRALRDEGTSHHYVRAGAFAYPSHPLTARLRTALADAAVPFREGTTWTIDAPYRETVGELRRYRAAGYLTVEMEASAVFAVAARRRRAAAAIFVVSDHLRERGWEPRFQESIPVLRRTFDLVARTLRSRAR